MNLAACLGACLGPVIIGSFTVTDPLGGWRNFYVGASSAESKSRLLTRLTVGSDGLLGLYSCWHLLRLPTSQATHKI